jgi:hypothetical protein
MAQLACEKFLIYFFPDITGDSQNRIKHRIPAAYVVLGLFAKLEALRISARVQ